MLADARSVVEQRGQVLQPAGHSRAVDQGAQERCEMDAAEPVQSAGFQEGFLQHGEEPAIILDSSDNGDKSLPAPATALWGERLAFPKAAADDGQVPKIFKNRRDVLSASCEPHVSIGSPKAVLETICPAAIIAVEW